MTKGGELLRCRDCEHVKRSASAGQFGVADQRVEWNRKLEGGRKKERKKKQTQTKIENDVEMGEKGHTQRRPRKVSEFKVQQEVVVCDSQ